MQNEPDAPVQGLGSTPKIVSAPSSERSLGARLYAGYKGGLMSVWYLYVKSLTRVWPSIKVREKRLAISPGVYKPLENEYACADYCRAGERVLDLGSGCGVCSIFCAPIASQVVAVDINPTAVRNTRENCARLGLANVTAFQSDMFANVEGRFDLIVANAPYIAADFADEEEQFATSVRYLPTLFAKAADHLTNDGRLLIQFPYWFRKRIERLADRHGLRVVSMRPLPRKSLALSLLSLAYLQVGFRSTYFLLEPRSAELKGREKLAA
jgi:methylase of polypeptide subunit release factors